MNENIIVRYIPLPAGVRAFTIPDSAGDYNVYINDALSSEQQKRSFDHEVCHIENGDFFRDEDAVEIEKKASPEQLEKIKTGTVSINKAHEMIKANEAKKKAGEIVEKEEVSSGTGKGINQDSFRLGVLFVLSELEKGKKKSQILKDKRIAKLDLEELELSDEDSGRIAQRFGIV